MQSEKTSQIIETIKAMPEKEADILEIFIAGFRAGKQTMVKERKEESNIQLEMRY